MNLSSINNGSQPHPNGFTLIEILAAALLSFIIIIGAYNIYHTLITVETSFTEKEKGLMPFAKLTRLFQKDLRCMTGSLSLNKTGVGQSLVFTSTHSLYFNSTLPVEIRYYLAKKDNKQYLMREEIEAAKNVDLTLRLLKGTDNLEFSFSSGQGTWLEFPENDTKVVRIKYNYEGRQWIIVGGTLL